MQDKPDAQLGFVRSRLPWLIAAGMLILYVVTLNRWVSVSSLPFVAKVAGWDLNLPQQAPLFFLLTFPVRWVPEAWQPALLHLFSAICAALTLALLARSVSLLPHDRTHDQRQRERSEFSFLTIPSAWLPPVLAALVCGLELTFWEHSTSATNELLDLLLFAYCIRCLLEYRLFQQDSWLIRMGLVYGLGVTNNWAMIGFAPGFLVAILWIKGRSFFDFAFLIRFFGAGLLGLSASLLLPLAWMIADVPNVTFWQVLKANLAYQKSLLLDVPVLRNRALILSLTSILPVVIMGVRWPTTSGDTSAAGTAMTNLMFRVIHIAFLVACIWVAFDQKFSPRSLGLGLAFLSFYYLGALAIGYFSGYVLLVFGESRPGKSWHRRAQFKALNRAVTAAVWVAVVAVPAALIYQNWNLIRAGNGRLLSNFASLSARHIPAEGAMIMSDDPYGLFLLNAHFSREGTDGKHLFVHTHSLANPNYHRQLARRYPQRWPDTLQNEPADERIDDMILLQLVSALARTNQVYYLHPSFGFYFERFYPQPRGLVYQLAAYPTNAILPPAPAQADLDLNRAFWKDLDQPLASIQALIRQDSRDARYLGDYYARALNEWGVTLQRDKQLEEAAKSFESASRVNTNNVTAYINLEYNRTLRTGESRTEQITKTIEDRFGRQHRSWETVMLHNGAFDHPDFCFRLGEIFLQRGLYRQSAIQLDRVVALEPTNVVARLSLANVFLLADRPDHTLREVAAIRAPESNLPIQPGTELELIRLEAAAQFAKSDLVAAEKVLLGAHEKYPQNPAVLDTLVQFYTQAGQTNKAAATSDKLVQTAPDNPQVLLSRATLHLNTGELEQALALADKVLSRIPDHAQALLFKAFLSIQQKNYKQALDFAQRVTQNNPENIDALLYEAVAQIETKNHADALEPLNTVLKLQPSNSNALRNRAIVHLNTGHLDEARKDYETLRRIIPRYYVAYFGLAEIAYRQKNTKEAVRNYELYLQYAPQVAAAEMQQEMKLVNDRLKELKTAAR
jgi:tetratricopeptide (TPR) repeat protein